MGVGLGEGVGQMIAAIGVSSGSDQVLLGQQMEAAWGSWVESYSATAGSA